MRGKRTIRRKLSAVIVAVAFIAAACTITGTVNFEVDTDGYSGVLMTLYRKVTNQVGTLYLVKHQDINATADFLYDLDIEGWGPLDMGIAEWHTALTMARPDLEWNIQDTINQGSQNNWNVDGPCLVLNVWVSLEWGGYSKHYDWRSVGNNYYSCQIGEVMQV